MGLGLACGSFRRIWPMLEMRVQPRLFPSRLPTLRLWSPWLLPSGVRTVRLCACEFWWRFRSQHGQWLPQRRRAPLDWLGHTLTSPLALARIARTHLRYRQNGIDPTGWAEVNKVQLCYSRQMTERFCGSTWHSSHCYGAESARADKRPGQFDRLRRLRGLLAAILRLGAALRQRESKATALVSRPPTFRRRKSRPSSLNSANTFPADPGSGSGL